MQVIESDKKTTIKINLVSNEHKSLKLTTCPVQPDWIMHAAKYLKSTPGPKF